MPYLLDDLAFHALTAGCLLALTPGVVASSDASLTLIPFAFVPVLAIYFGGRQAGIMPTVRSTTRLPSAEPPAAHRARDQALQTAQARASARSGDDHRS